MSTPNLNLPEMPANSFQPSVPFNESMQILDALVQLVPQDKDLTAPPATVAGDAGKTWLVAAAPTGAWAGHAQHIAICTGAGLWAFVVPKAGWCAYVQDEAKDYRFLAGVWVLIA